MKTCQSHEQKLAKVINPDCNAVDHSSGDDGYGERILRENSRSDRMPETVTSKNS
jgi:hypothetical protein